MWCSSSSIAALQFSLCEWGELVGLVGVWDRRGGEGERHRAHTLVFFALWQLLKVVRLSQPLLALAAKGASPTNGGGGPALFPAQVNHIINLLKNDEFQEKNEAHMQANHQYH